MQDLHETWIAIKLGGANRPQSPSAPQTQAAAALDDKN